MREGVMDTKDGDDNHGLLRLACSRGFYQGRSLNKLMSFK